MSIVELKDSKLQGGDGIYYRSVYNGTAVIEYASRIVETAVTWTIEMTPFGTKNVSCRVLEQIDYPLVPLLKELKKKIEEIDEEGLFPLNK